MKFLTKWNREVDTGEVLSSESKTEPFFVDVKEQVERLLLAGQRLVNERAYEFLANQEVPEDYVPLLRSSDLVDVEAVLARLQAKMAKKREEKEEDPVNEEVDTKPGPEAKAED